MPGVLAKLNLGRLYWTTGREALAVDTWRAAGEPTWIAILLQHNVDPQPASASTDRLVRFVLDEVGGSYDDEVTGRVRRAAIPAVPRRGLAFPACARRFGRTTAGS